MKSLRQIPLDITLDDQATFKNFYAGTNRQLVTYLLDFCRITNDQYAYIWGNNSSGRTHLLQACCHLVDLNNQAVMYLPLKSIANNLTALLENATNNFLICIDDINNIAKQQETALFHAFNKLHDAKVKLLISGPCSPQNLAIQLPDLKSRLASGITFKIHDLNETQKIATLIMRAKTIGLNLSQKTAEFLSKRYQRDMQSLMDILAKLSQETLIAKHKLTIPFIKQVLAQKH